MAKKHAYWVLEWEKWYEGEGWAGLRALYGRKKTALEDQRALVGEVRNTRIRPLNYADTLDAGCAAESLALLGKQPTTADGKPILYRSKVWLRGRMGPIPTTVFGIQGGMAIRDPEIRGVTDWDEGPQAYKFRASDCWSTAKAVPPMADQGGEV